MGSAVVANWIAHAAFWVLLAYGVALRKLRAGAAAVFVAVWVSGLICLPYLPWEPAHAMFSSFVAVLDIALVFTIFKGDVQLT